jgi:heterotetrameric sarcosine oxidase alpha subunit
MTGQRLASGGLVDRAKPIRFTFDGRSYAGFQGDTLASALLANGVKLFGRSFKYHRPRGVLSAGVEEPNALVSVGEGGRYEPNTRATDVAIYDGLVAHSQNRWPSLDVDIGAVNQWISRFIPAGFYYKTFFGGPKLWLLYEHFIRRAAGLGDPPVEAEVDAFEHRAAFCDVLVVGAGPAGLAAAKAAVEAGARVMLVDQDERIGGSFLRDGGPLDHDDLDANRIRTQVVAGGGRVLTRTTAFGYWDHDLVTLAERLVESGQAPGAGGLAQRLWRVRAKRVVLATGAIERPLLFAGNDRPGVMLSSAVRTYVSRYAVLPGRRVVIATCNDDAYLTALAIHAAGGDVVAVLDSRAEAAATGDIVRQAQSTLPVYFDAQPVQTLGGKSGVRRLEARVGGPIRGFACDLVAMSGGFTPVVHLHMHAGGGLAFDEATGGFTPTTPRQGQISAGAAAGVDGLEAVLHDGWAAGLKAAQSLRPPSSPLEVSPPPSASPRGGRMKGVDYEPAPGVNLKTAFVDYQNDVTAADVDLAWREGYRSVEHLKRYTTLGMATDQGKTSNLVGLARLAKAEGRPMPQVGLTTFRPPYTPVTLGTLAGEAVGDHVAPTRRLALHDLHAAQSPIWQPSGYWMRPRAFPVGSETLIAAALREARAVRHLVGITDVSTLAKFEIAGPDAAAFLERICATTVAKLSIGRGRYTFMLREDGLVVDDGTVWRLDETRYLLTSSTGGADRMVAHLSYVRRLLAPTLKVAVAGVQEHWAGAAIAGPLARAVIAECVGVAPPRHMSVISAEIAEVPVKLLAASYSGERAFEVYAPAHRMAPVWAALTSAVQARQGATYGLEALELLRIEKGHVEVGAEIDGRRTPADLGLAKMLNPRGGFVGAAALQRPALHAADRLSVVGLVSDGPIPEGAMLVAQTGATPEGHVTSAGLRLVKGEGEGGVALAMLKGGGARLGETLLAASPTRGRTARVSVVSPHMYDPAGERYRD